jgi:hypothetical protein
MPTRDDEDFAREIQAHLDLEADRMSALRERHVQDLERTTPSLRVTRGHDGTTARR